MLSSVHVNASDEKSFFKNLNLLGITSSFCSLPDFRELLFVTKTTYEHKQYLLKNYLGEDAKKYFDDAEIPVPEFFRLCQSVLSDKNIAFSDLKVHRHGDNFEVKIWNPTVSMFFVFNAILSQGGEVKLSTNGIVNTVGAILVPSHFPFFLKTNGGTYTLFSFYDFFNKFHIIYKPPASSSWIERRFAFGDELNKCVQLRNKMGESSNFPLEITHEIPLKMALFVLSKSREWQQTEIKEPTHPTYFGNLKSGMEEEPKAMFMENLTNCNQLARVSADNKRKKSSISSTKSAKCNELAKKL